MLSCEPCLIILEVKVSQGSRLSSVTTAFMLIKTSKYPTHPLLWKTTPESTLLCPYVARFKTHVKPSKMTDAQSRGDEVMCRSSS